MYIDQTLYSVLVANSPASVVLPVQGVPVMRIFGLVLSLIFSFHSSSTPESAKRLAKPFLSRITDQLLR